jgi:hypothetical protein
MSNGWVSGGLQLSQGTTNKGKRMNLSVETKLATALGAGFVALVLGVMAQTQNDSGIATEYGMSDNPALTNPSRNEFQSSSSRGMMRESDDANGASASTKRTSEDAQVDHSYDD